MSRQSICNVAALCLVCSFESVLHCPIFITAAIAHNPVLVCSLAPSTKAPTYSNLLLRGGGNPVNIPGPAFGANQSTAETEEILQAVMRPPGPMCHLRVMDRTGHTVVDRPAGSWSAVAAAAASASGKLEGRGRATTAAGEDDWDGEDPGSVDLTPEAWARLAADAADDPHSAALGANITIIEYRRAAAEEGGVLAGDRCCAPRRPACPVAVASGVCAFVLRFLV